MNLNKIFRIGSAFVFLFNAIQAQASYSLTPNMNLETYGHNQNSSYAVTTNILSSSGSRTHKEIVEDLQKLNICSGGSANSIIEAANFCTKEDLSRNIANIQLLNKEINSLEARLRPLRDAESKSALIPFSTALLATIGTVTVVAGLGGGNLITNRVGRVAATLGGAALVAWAISIFHADKKKIDVMLKEGDLETAMIRLKSLKRDLRARMAIVTTIQTLKSQAEK